MSERKRDLEKGTGSKRACTNERELKRREREREREIVTGRERKEHRLCAGA